MSIFVVPFASPNPQGIGSSVFPVQHWRQLFDRDAPYLDMNSVRLSRSADSWEFYTLAYAIDSFTSMYEATGETEYLDRALTYTENMIAYSRPSLSLPTSRFHDSYQGWVSERQGDYQAEVPLYESYAWRYVTRMLRVIRQGPLYANSGYRANYKSILRYTEVNIFDKWYTRGADEFIYRSRTHMAAHWAYIARDLSILTNDDSLRERYRTVVRNIDFHLPNYGSSLRAQLRPATGDPFSYWWSDVWGETKRPGQDIAHGNGVVAYVVEAHDSGGEWTDVDMARFCRTLTTSVIGPRRDHPRYVDGSGDGTGWIADGFAKLGRYDKRVQLQLQEHVVQNSQFYAVMAVNAKRLKG